MVIVEAVFLFKLNGIADLKLATENEARLL